MQGNAELLQKVGAVENVSVGTSNFRNMRRSRSSFSKRRRTLVEVKKLFYLDGHINIKICLSISAMISAKSAPPLVLIDERFV